MPRALVGRGLGRLVCGQIESGAVDIEAGAFGFGDHIGSWIAAGWARLVDGVEFLTALFGEERLRAERAAKKS